MNLFFLDLCLEECVRAHLDRHCIKMILEIAQLLYTTHHICQSDDTWISRHLYDTRLSVYKKTHQNHPMAIWTRATRKNYKYVVKFGRELCREYHQRYGRQHACLPRLRWLQKNIPTEFQKPRYTKHTILSECDIPKGLSAVPLCMPVHCVTENLSLVDSYRKYYCMEKSSIATWKSPAEIPYWFIFL